MPGINAPSQQLMDKYAVNLPGQVEVIWQPLYHYQTYAAAGGTAFTFFQTPIGQGGLTLSDTNMQTAGAVPKGQTFVATALQVELLLDAADIFLTADPDSYLNDYYRVMTSRANLVLEIGSKPFLKQAPLGKFPPAHNIQAQTAISTTANNITEGMSFAQGGGQAFQIVPLTLTSNQNFVLTINFETAVAVATECRLGVTLHGYLFRNAQ